MAAQKNRGGKAGRKLPARKSRLWLRDGLNILGGLLVGGLVVWLGQQFLGGKGVRKASDQTLRVVEDTVPRLKPFAERYLAVEEKREEAADPLAGLDLSQPLCAPEAVDVLQGEFRSLPPEAMPLVWDFTLKLHDAEVLRKLLREQQDNPDKLAGILSRGFLSLLYENSQLLPKIRWELKGAGAKP